jgi:hypothetical protein
MNEKRTIGDMQSEVQILKRGKKSEGVSIMQGKI